MPVAQQDYASYKGFMDGSPILQITSLGIKTESGVQPVKLLSEGVGGWSDGSGEVTLSIGIVVPIGGQEFPYQQKCANKEFVEFQVFVGRNSYNGRGKITSVDLNHSVGDTASGTVEFLGPLKPFE
jgi:hypothetical protein